MKAKELIYNLQNLRAKGVQSQSNDLSDEQIMFMIDYYRAMLIRQQFDKNNNVGINLEQDLGIVELENVDKSFYLSNCNNFETSCIKRSKFEIPSILETKTEHYLNYVGTVDLSSSFQNTTYNKIKWDLLSKYTKDRNKTFNLNNHIYVYSLNKSLKYIRVRGVFNSTVEVRKYLQISGQLDTLDIYDFDYPLSPHMIDTITKMIIQTEFNILSVVPKDTLNDSKEN